MNVVITTISNIFQDNEYYSLEIDESIDESSTAKLCMFGRGVNTFDVHEELLEICPMNGTIKGSDLLECVPSYIYKHVYDLSKLV